MNESKYNSNAISLQYIFQIFYILYIVSILYTEKTVMNMKILVSMVSIYGMILVKTGCQDNLVKDSDFDNYVLQFTNDAVAQEYDYAQIPYHGSWYPDYLSTFRVRNINHNLNQYLDLKFYNFQARVCQNITLNASHTYTFYFQFTIDGNIPEGNIIVQKNQQAFISISGITFQFYLLIQFQASVSINSFCFRGYTLSNDTQGYGVLIDNVEIKLKTIISEINFTTKIHNQVEKQVVLVSDYQINISRIQAFSQTQIKVEGQSLEIVSVNIAENQNLLVLIVKINKQYESEHIPEIILPKWSYVDSNQNSVEFIIGSSQAIPVLKYMEKNTTLLHNKYKYIVDAGEKVSNTINIIVGFTFTGVIFKLIGFINIMLMYMFIDISLLPADIRNLFEELGAFMFSQGMITSLSGMLNNGLVLKFQADPKQNDLITKQTQGSQFSAVGISNNLRALCVEDLIVIIMNICQIPIFWYLRDKIRAKFLIRTSLSKRLKESIQRKRNMIIQIISPSITWTLVSGIIIGQTSNLSYSNYSQKIYRSFFNLFPIIFLVFCLIWKFLKKTKKYRNHNNQIQEDLDIIQWMDLLYYATIGIIVGFQNTVIFFVLTTIFRVVQVAMIWIKRRRSLQIVIICLRKIPQLVIHFSFLYLYVLQKQNNIQNAEEIPQQMHAAIQNTSLTILYFIIIGCIFQFLVLIYQIVLSGFSTIRLLWQVCKKSNKIVPQIQERKQRDSDKQITIIFDNKSRTNTQHKIQMSSYQIYLPQKIKVHKANQNREITIEDF